MSKMKFRIIFIIILGMGLRLNIYSSKNYENEKIAAKGYDILRYDLNLKINMENGSFSGINDIKFITLKNINKISLHSFGLKISYVNSNGENLKYETDELKESIIIYLPEKKNLPKAFEGKENPEKKPVSGAVENDTVSIQISYTYDPDAKRKPERRGFYFYKKNRGSGFFDEVLENEAYTMSEPSDARCWFPCWDEPNDKVLSSISLTVDSGYTAVSNGLLDLKNINNDETITYRWKNLNPISTYLMSFAVSKYSSFSHTYQKSGQGEKMEVQYYFWPADSNGVFFNAIKAFKSVVKMIEVYSDIFGEYPFEKYGMVSVAPFDFGAEEHQTMTTIHRFWLHDDEDGIAHELAHQWWGNLVTCGDWKDIWLNESFATYSEALWVEKISDKNTFISKIKSFYRLGSEWEAAIYDPEGQGKKLFSDIVYQKGALVLHTLRNIIGDSLFFEILRKYKHKYMFSYATHSDFMDIVSKVCKKNMDGFFEQYIFSKGWPKIAYTWNYDSGKQQLKLNFNQVQSDKWPLYSLPFDVNVTGSTQKKLRIELSGKRRKQEFTFQIDFKPENVIIDPERKIFMEIIK